MGKGCRPRPVDKKTWDKNFDSIFRRKVTPTPKRSKVTPKEKA